MKSVTSYLSVAALASLARAGSIKDIKHVVLFMQENRAFNHYFGTMAGVRGFSDPNAQINPDGKSVFYQEVIPEMSPLTDHLLPFYLNAEGGYYLNATQCMQAGSNLWAPNHAALNGGLNNHWPMNNSQWSWGYFKKEDIPVHFGIAESWTVADMYQEGVMSCTDPNRVTWMSGSVNVPGGKQNASQGGPVFDNNRTPGCEINAQGEPFNCYPFDWKTVPEFYEDAGVSWQVYQDTDNYVDDPLVFFKLFQNLKADTSLYNHGVAFNANSSLDAFYADAAAGTLPLVSYIVGPGELSEHQPNRPIDGGWLQKKIVEAIVNGKGYNNTVLMISYDETGGWGDHVVPYHSPEGTPGEWLEDPYGEVGYTYSGPGFRLPFYIISPWTRGGHVFTEHADHNSQIMFVEEWLSELGYNVTTDQMNDWRREHMSNLLNAFDFDHPDYSVPTLPYAPDPLTDSNGNLLGPGPCQAQYPNQNPPIPYGDQTEEDSLVSENGYKAVRGYLTEGRYLVFEFGGYALTNPGSSATSFTATEATAAHDSINQRWVVHAFTEDGNTFTITSALDGRYIGSHTSLVDHNTGAETYTITFLAGSGYALQKENGKYLTIDSKGNVQIASDATYFQAYSVTYSS
ncbi:non-hemolytic phospholipase C precursor [Xylogone sp. PMI_703]|nr:non-hemolytic phospholipase C precursor [Xylogone sp. PMI_703]